MVLALGGPVRRETMLMHPENVYFGRADIDRLVALVWQLAEEIYMLRSRLVAVEGILTDHGILQEGELRADDLSDRILSRLSADNAAMLDRLVSVVTESDDHRTPMRRQFLASLGRMPADDGPAAQ